MAVTDLTGTKWLLNSELFYGDGEEIPQEYMTQLTYAYDATAWLDDTRDVFDIGSGGINAGYLNFTSNNENFIGLVSEDNLPLEAGNCVEVYRIDWTNQAYRTIEITGGTDATNATLIAWLETNAEQIIEPTGNEYTLTQNLTNLTNGNITLTITADEGYTLPAQADIVVTGGTIVSYDDETGELVVTAGTTAVEVTCESAVSTISFSIDWTGDAEQYQADAGMTWAEWVASAYNTLGLSVVNDGIGMQANTLGYQGTPVLASDEIVANRTYSRISGND